MKKTLLLLMTCSLAFLAACGQPVAKEDQSAQNGLMTISFDYMAQDGYASNQFAVWVENTDGAVVKTLYATRFAAKGGFEKRPDAIPLWVEGDAFIRGALTIEYMTTFGWHNMQRVNISRETIHTRDAVRAIRDRLEQRSVAR